MTSLSKFRYILLLLLVATLAAACNLTSAPEEQITLTEAATSTPQPTRTLLPTGGIPTTLPLTQFVIPTARPGQIPATTVILPPTWVASVPTSTPMPISIVILSPIPGNIVAGNVQVLGAAIHPQFLQYQLEFGPDPNPGNLWFPATSIVQTPVINGLLGIWNTTTVQDSIYQLRLRVYLRDGSSLYTVVNNIRIQNQVPTPVPSNTPNVQRPIAAFTQDRASGQAPLVIRFTNQSSGQISSYSWNFGDGGTSPDANPTYTFRSPGVFNVTLTVTGPGGSSNVTRQINVQSATAPVAAFIQDRVSGPSPLTVRFTNQSTGQITAYNWNFGDGTTSTEQNPSHQFVAVGTYNVILTVTGPGGSSSVTRKITVEDPVVPPPVAAFRTDKTTGDAPLTVQFINQSTGQIQSFNWDFGDGSTSTDTNPAHVYVNPGDYTARLTVVGPGGQNVAQTAIAVTQKPNAPLAAFSANPTSGNTPLTVQFTNQSTGQITSYQWDFGDGSTSAEQNPGHTYTAAGTYTVTLVVTGPGGTDDAQTVISAAQPVSPPDAAFNPNPPEGSVPLTVQFTNQSAGQNLTHAWDFGDGTTSSEVNPVHTYNTPGTYTARLSVSNEGGTDTAEAQIRVTAPLPTDTPVPTLTPLPAEPVAAFIAAPLSGNAPLTVQFTNQSSGDITSLTWDFGDGTQSADLNPAHEYTAAGTFTVSLTVTGPGGSNVTTQIITVNAVQPPALSLNTPIAFTSNRDGSNDVFVLKPDGTLTNLTGTASDDHSPAWSPDGSKIVFVSDRDGNNEIYVMNEDGTNLTNLSNHPANDHSPAWSPDGSKIVFVSDRDGNREIYSMNADGTDPQNLTNHPANDFDPVIAADGSQRLAFVTDRDGNNEIYIANQDGTLVNITNNPASDTAPDWKSNASQLIFVSDRDGNSDVYVMDTGGNNLVNLTNSGATELSPVWSPNDTQILYVANPDGNSDIYVMNADGSNPTNITNHPANDTAPDWRP